MAPKLELVSRNPTLKLAFKSVIFAASVFWLRSADFNFLLILFFLGLFSIFYLRPAINAEKFWIPILAIMLIIFIMPELGGAEFYFAIWSGLLFYLILGIKNLIFLNKQIWCYSIHFLTIIALNAYFFISQNGIMSQAIVFITSFYLFRELYPPKFNYHIGQRAINLVSAVQSLILIEMLWALTLFSLGILTSTLLVMFVMFVIQDVLNRHFGGFSLTVEVILKDAIAFFIFLLLIFLFLKPNFFSLIF